MARHERLLAWQRVHQLTLAVYEATNTWPTAETYGLVSQARRAASSAGANIAEGAARETEKFTTTFFGEGGRVLAKSNEVSPVYKFTGGEKYVRARVDSSFGASAWTQPAFR